MAKLRRSIKTTQEDVEEEQFDFETDLAIDPDFLDAEFINHSILAMKYGKASAAANKEAKEAEERVKTLRSQLVKDANTDPDSCLGKGIKPTAPIVEAYYRDDEDYKKVKQEWIDAVFEADILNHAVFAVQARKSALENLVRLHGQEYFASPQEPHDLPDAVQHLEEIKKKSVQTKVKRRMNK